MKPFVRKSNTHKGLEIVFIPQKIGIFIKRIINPKRRGVVTKISIKNLFFFIACNCCRFILSERSKNPKNNTATKADFQAPK